LIRGAALREPSAGQRKDTAMAREDRTEATRARVAELYAAYAGGDMPAVMEGMAADVAWHSLGEASLPWSGRWRGPEGVAGYFAALAAACRVIAYDIEHIIADGDWASVLATIGVRYHADGTECTYAKVDILRLAGGRIAEFREFYDTATVARDLGRTSTARSG
jgi:ketosteroid isomerase-like protein